MFGALPSKPSDDTDDDEEPSLELIQVRHRRMREAMKAGMDLTEAQLFADSDIDTGELRKRLAQGVPAEWIARIVL